jgi:hypothetical protein
VSDATVRAARLYFSRGWPPVAVYPRSKKPMGGPGWERLRLTEEELPQRFANGANLGVLLGEPAHGLVDVDLDIPEAVALAGWLPPTEARFGRPGKPLSHRLYYTEPAPSTTQYLAPGVGMIVELRGTGGQTVMPPSTHESGETVCWESDGEPARVPLASLRTAVAWVAAGALLARTWPVEGSRHTASLALAGALLRAGWAEDDMRDFIVDVATAAGDDEAEERGKDARTTARRLAAGEQATGMPGVVAVFGQPVADKVEEWLGIKAGPAASARANGDMGAEFGMRRPRPAERPAFPLEALGVPWLEQFITTPARALACPVDFVAGAVLGAVSVALAGAVRVHVMNRFYPFGALWLVLVGPPGSGKGPAYELATEALQDVQDARYRAYLEQRGAYAAELDRWEAEPKKVRGPRPTPPVYRPITTDDPTMEALEERLAENQRGIGVVNEEAAGWLRGMGQYKRGGGNDEEKWLRIFDARPIESDRKADGPRRVKRPVVPVLATTQPERIASLLRGNKNGLRERICCVYPPDAGMHPLKEQPGLDALDQFRGLIAGLLAIGLMKEGQPRLLRLTREARDMWTEQETILCDATREPAFNPASLDAYSKGRGIAGRLACLLPVLRHVAACAPALAEGQALADDLAERITATLPADVGAPVVQDAWHLTAYFLDHSEAVFRENSAGAGLLARAVRWLEQRGGEATLRELALARLAGDQSASAARELANALVDHGLARIEERPNPGARPSTVVILAALEDA